ncbi:MAG: ThiF family adenylyltransferase [Patescibacteria group bacterium]|nr:ThiF family adenylyltransferase [Patescibacteria group bacterium]MCL5262040.1 ThiF family adenylyltransferase [Patescibacteria group bacterium]
MSHKLVNPNNKDLKKLRDLGYVIDIKGGFLLVHQVPYVNANKQVAYGTLVSKLDLADDRTVQPQNHVIYFVGDHPCNSDGSMMLGIKNASDTQKLADGVIINHTFSARPSSGRYADYYEKVTTYVRILSGQAEMIDPSATAQTFAVIESDEPDSVFHYTDTNSSRAEIDLISEKLKGLKIAIIGTGGTGSYVLDFVSKTPVQEIHLFDEDDFFSHNAFRMPGAASKEKLRQSPKKVHYLAEVYSNMHKGITAHDHYVTAENFDKLSGMSFVFLCIDKSEAKEPIISGLLAKNIPFIDVGMGIHAVNNSLTGSLRVTTVTSVKNDHVGKSISFADAVDNEYVSNIQIAELNAMNAALAVIKWKKLFGFYHDSEKEYNTSYTISVNKIINDDTIA